MQRHPKDNSAWKQNECALRIGFVFFNAGEASIHFPTVGCSEAEDWDNSVECQHLARIKNRGTAIHLPVWELREYLTRQHSKRRMISAAHSSCRTTVPGPPSLSIQASKEEEEAATLSSECKLSLLYRYVCNRKGCKTHQSCGTTLNNRATVEKGTNLTCAIKWTRKKNIWGSQKERKLCWWSQVLPCSCASIRRAKASCEEYCARGQTSFPCPTWERRRKQSTLSSSLVHDGVLFPSPRPRGHFKEGITLLLCL